MQLLLVFAAAMGCARALRPCTVRAARRVAQRSMPDGGEGYDGVDIDSSDALDVMDDDGWHHDDHDEGDAAVLIHADRDDAENPLDAHAYFFESADDDAELRKLLADLEAEFGEKGDAASRSILASVRSCGELLDAEGGVDTALDARASLAFAATARGEAPEDVDRDSAGDLVAVDGELADAFALLDEEPLDEHLDEMYGWLVGNASRGGGYAVRQQKPARTLGLDLGTTNSAAAAVDASGAPKLLPPGLIPSVVAFLDADVEDGDVDASGRIALRDDDGAGVVAVVGAEAEAYRATAHAPSVCSRVKRVLALDSTLSERRRTSAADEDPEKRGGTTLLRVPALPSRISAAEVSAEVVRYMREKAGEALGGGVDRCVVGVPARFDDAAREATKTAATLGGFSDVVLLEEPVAAALAYGAARARKEAAQDETVLVFDLGGGTLDVCVVELQGGHARVVAVGGDAKLGGDDFDAALAEHLGDRFFDAHGVAVRAPSARLRLLGLAERAKIELSRANETVASARGLARVAADGVTRRRGGRPLDLDAVVTRRLYEALCRPLLLRLEACVSATCLEAGVSLASGWASSRLEEDGRPRGLDRVLLVGGSTRMPAVGRMLRRLTGLPLNKIAANEEVHPDEAVALGCAIRAAALDKTEPLAEASLEVAA